MSQVFRQLGNLKFSSGQSTITNIGLLAMGVFYGCPGPCLSRTVGKVTRSDEFYVVTYQAKFEQENLVIVTVAFHAAEPKSITFLAFDSEKIVVVCVSIEAVMSVSNTTDEVPSENLKAAQQSVHPTGGSLRAFRQFSGLKLVPSKQRYLVPPTSG